MVAAAIRATTPAIGNTGEEKGETFSLATIWKVLVTVWPLASVTSTLTVYDPALKVWVGFCSVLVEPSPKFQL